MSAPDIQAALNSADVEVRPALVQWIAKMGEPLYGYIAPTGYPDTADYWVNTGALLERLNQTRTHHSLFVEVFQNLLRTIHHVSIGDHVVQSLLLRRKRRHDKSNEKSEERSRASYNVTMFPLIP